MRASIQPNDEIVKIWETPGELAFDVRAEDKQLRRVMIQRPVWSSIQEIGFTVRSVETTEPDQKALETIRHRFPTVQLPANLVELQIADNEAVKIRVIFVRDS